MFNKETKNFEIIKLTKNDMLDLVIAAKDIEKFNMLLESICKCRPDLLNGMNLVVDVIRRYANSSYTYSQNEAEDEANYDRLIQLLRSGKESEEILNLIMK
ncbi:MAG: hypothetical protein ACI4S2_05955 [Lachnospiraceae bacterium]